MCVLKYITYRCECVSPKTIRCTVYEKERSCSLKSEYVKDDRLCSDHLFENFKAFREEDPDAVPTMGEQGFAYGTGPTPGELEREQADKRQNGNRQANEGISKKEGNINNEK